MKSSTGSMRIAGWVAAAVIWTTGICFAAPSAPVLTLSVSGTRVDLQWTVADGAQGYNLYFAPYPGAAYMGNLDMGGTTQVSFSLESGAAFYVAVTAYDGSGEGGFSNMEYFVLASGSYPVVDTGQTLFYGNMSQISQPAKGDAFFGQDAQYAGNAPSYTTGQDIVHDNVTGLTWTRSPDWDGDGDIDAGDKMSFSEAQGYPDILNAQNYGGYSDWRLPSIKALYSLMNFAGTDPSGPDGAGAVPFVDTDYFDFGYGDTASGQRIIDAQFWSATVYAGSVFNGQTAVFGLNLADGRIKGYPAGGGAAKTNYVYFVRGNTAYGINEFVDNGDGTVTDSATGLMWSRDDSGTGMDWEAALAWVQAKNEVGYLGYDDWRLPNAKEMQSIVDYTRAPDATGSAATDPVFNITQITNEAGETDYPWFWTGTTHKRANGSGEAGVYICFGRSMGYANGKWMDVHGAGAQRSDRKADDFSNFTYVPDGWYFGKSPQGDATRIYNYVRLVRDVNE